MPEGAGAGLTALLPLLPGADSDEDTAELELVRKRALSPGGQEGPNAKRQKVGSSCLTSATLDNFSSQQCQAREGGRLFGGS